MPECDMRCTGRRSLYCCLYAGGRGTLRFVETDNFPRSFDLRKTLRSAYLVAGMTDFEFAECTGREATSE